MSLAAGHRLVVLMRRLFGVELRRPSAGDPRRSLDEALRFLADLGFAPSLVIDIGVGNGTGALYDAFPEAPLLLIEPLREFEPRIRRVLENRSGRYIIAAAGATNGQARINVHRDHISGSSLLEEEMGPVADGETRPVEMVRLDDVVGRDPAGPFILKVDVQGAELDVLRGAPETMRRSLFVVLEVSLFRFLRGMPEFHDVVVFMKRSGFVAYDIIPTWTRPLDGALGQCDILFVQEDSVYRADHSFATPEQRRDLFLKGHK